MKLLMKRHTNETDVYYTDKGHYFSWISNDLARCGFIYEVGATLEDNKLCVISFLDDTVYNVPCESAKVFAVRKDSVCFINLDESDSYWMFNLKTKKWKELLESEVTDTTVKQLEWKEITEGRSFEEIASAVDEILFKLDSGESIQIYPI